MACCPSSSMCCIASSRTMSDEAMHARCLVKSASASARPRETRRHSPPESCETERLRAASGA
eukprot:5521436-Pleurochrysis_carterae.AAC.2